MRRLTRRQRRGKTALRKRGLVNRDSVEEGVAYGPKGEVGGEGRSLPKRSCRRDVDMASGFNCRSYYGLDVTASHKMRRLVMSPVTGDYFRHIPICDGVLELYAFPFSQTFRYIVSLDPFSLGVEPALHDV